MNISTISIANITASIIRSKEDDVIYHISDIRTQTKQKMESNATTRNLEESMQQLEPYTKFDARDKVILHSLIEAAHLNGRRAIVHEYAKVDDSSDGELCCKVRILPEENDKREYYMLTKNMALDYPSGQKVKLYGLVGAKHLNGSVATIDSYRYGLVCLCIVVFCGVCAGYIGRRALLVVSWFC